MSNLLSGLLYYCLLIPLSYIPLSVSYFLVDFIFFPLVYYIFPYRKKVVLSNLKIAFPNRDKMQLEHLSKAFYKHFLDVVFETIHSFTMSENELNKRVKILNAKEISEIINAQTNLICVGGHCGNWEWSSMKFASEFKINSFGVYKKLNNNFFNKTLVANRGRFGLQMIESKNVIKLFKSHTENFCIGFLADQNPGNLNKAIWINFFGRVVPFANGVEVFAEKYKSQLIYGAIKKVKRGYYMIEYHLLNNSENRFSTKTEMFAYMLERDIHAQPESYLWTHRRWKHAKQTL